MVFSSLTFLFAFLPITLIIYYLVPTKGKNIVLLVSGLVFYAWGEPIYVLAMVLSTMIDYTAGRIIGKYDDKPKIRLACLIVSLVMNLGLLSVFKYLGFLIESANLWFGLSIPNPNLPLPIGISFFTFQSMSYTIDVYRRKIKVQKNPVSFAAFVTMFPQIVAGPIVRYEDIQNEIDSRSITEKNLGDGISRFIVGLGKKALIANSIGALWSQVKLIDYGELSAVTAWLGVLAFGFQIYFDFSGYSDMAIGLGKMLGFTFPENFDYPFMSHSISEFWRRWHMTLGAWFREYVYFPLGGSRKGLARTLLNLFLVWAATGIWHGAAWNYMIWGVYFGIIIVIERLFLGKWLEKAPALVSWLYTFLLVTFSWILFEGVANTVNIVEMMKQAGTLFGAMFGANGTIIDNLAISLLINYGLIFAICVLGASDLPKRTADFIREKAPKWMGYIFPVSQALVMLASVAYITTSSYNPFLYFNF